MSGYERPSLPAATVGALSWYAEIGRMAPVASLLRHTKQIPRPRGASGGIVAGGGGAVRSILLAFPEAVIIGMRTDPIPNNGIFTAFSKGAVMRANTH